MNKFWIISPFIKLWTSSRECMKRIWSKPVSILYCCIIHQYIKHFTDRSITKQVYNNYGSNSHKHTYIIQYIIMFYVLYILTIWYIAIVPFIYPFKILLETIFIFLIQYTKIIMVSLFMEFNLFSQYYKGIKNPLKIQICITI